MKAYYTTAIDKCQALFLTFLWSIPLIFGEYKIIFQKVKIKLDKIAKVWYNTIFEPKRRRLLIGWF